MNPLQKQRRKYDTSDFCQNFDRQDCCFCTPEENCVGTQTENNEKVSDLPSATDSVIEYKPLRKSTKKPRRKTGRSTEEGRKTGRSTEARRKSGRSSEERKNTGHSTEGRRKTIRSDDVQLYDSSDSFASLPLYDEDGKPIEPCVCPPARPTNDNCACLSNLQKVVVDEANGGFMNYVFGRVTCNKHKENRLPCAFIVRASQRYEYHSGLYEEVLKEVEEYNAEFQDMGGGRMYVNSETRKIHVFGPCLGLGMANHENTAELMRGYLPQYTITSPRPGEYYTIDKRLFDSPCPTGDGKCVKNYTDKSDPELERVRIDTESLCSTPCSSLGFQPCS